MIIDSSAVVAILRNEPEGPGFAHKIEQAPLRRISAASFVEAAIVVENGRSAIASRKLDDLMREGDITIEPVTVEAAPRWPSPRRRRSSRRNSLFKGSDFPHTDVTPA